LILCLNDASDLDAAATVSFNASSSEFSTPGILRR
jgi:hypothetical protein